MRQSFGEPRMGATFCVCSAGDQHDLKKKQEGPTGALRPLAFFCGKLSGSQLSWSPREKECSAIVAALLNWHGWEGKKRVEVRTDHRSLENWATEDLKTVGGSPPRQARWHELFSKFDLHVVYTPGPVNPVGDFLSRWAYPANQALGDVSIHGTAQAAGDVRDMMASKREELLARPLVFRAVLAPVVTKCKAARRALGRPGVIHPLRLRLQWGGDEAKGKTSTTEANCQDKKILEVPQEGNTYTWGGCSQCFWDKFGYTLPKLLTLQKNVARCLEWELPRWSEVSG